MWLLWLLLAFVQTASAQSLGATSAVARCDFKSTRQAREILKRELFQPLEAMNYMVSERCPINPNKDMLLPFEDNKKMIRKRKWECKICKKQFESEMFLDQHFVNRHEHSHKDPTATMCLGTAVCDILHCATHLESKPAKCSPKLMQKRQMFCQQLLHRCLAYDPAGHTHKENDEPHDHDQLQHGLEELELKLRHQFCEPLHCHSTLIEDAAAAAMWQNLFVLACVLILVCLGVYYIVLWLSYSHSSGAQDLRRRKVKPKSPLQRLQAYFAPKSKTY